MRWRRPIFIFSAGIAQTLALNFNSRYSAARGSPGHMKVRAVSSSRRSLRRALIGHNGAERSAEGPLASMIAPIWVAPREPPPFDGGRSKIAVNGIRQNQVNDSIYQITKAGVEPLGTRLSVPRHIRVAARPLSHRSNHHSKEFS
jgi:hypothetical protein